MIKIILPWFIFILYVPISNSYCQINTQPSPHWVKKIEVDPELNIDQYKGKTSDGLLYLIIDKQDHLKNQTSYRHYAYQLLTTKGVQNYSEISVTYDPAYQRVYFHKLLIYREGATIDKLTPSKFITIQKEKSSERLVYDGSLTTFINLEDVRVNDIIEYSYSIIGFNPILNGKYAAQYLLEFSIPVDQVHLNILTPVQSPIFIKNHHFTKEPTISESGGIKTYTWYVKKSSAIKREDNIPDWYSPYGAVSVSQYKNWENVGKEFANFYSFDSKNKRIVEVANEIRKNNNRLEDRINKAIKFTQNNIRYLALENGISGYKPRSPQKIIKQRFGDCKDKSLLLVALLDQFGIPANAVLVNTISKGRVTNLLPSPGSFDHCVVIFEHNDTTIWIDPTIREQGGNFDGKYFPNYGQGLVLSKHAPKIDSIPTSVISNIKIEEELDISSIAEDHSLVVKTTYFGNSADREKKNFQENSIDEISSGYIDYYAELYGDVSIADNLSYSQNDTLHTFTVFESYKIKNIWKKSPKSTYDLEADISNTLVSTFYKVPDNKNRKMPYAITYPKILEVKTLLNLPDTWDKDNLLQKIEAPGIQARIKRKYKGKTCEFYFNLKTTKDQIEPGEIADYVEKVEQLADYEGRTYYFSPDSDNNAIFYSNSSSILFSYSVVVVAILVFLGRYLFFNFNPMPRSSSPEYMNIGGWLILPAIGIILAPSLFALGLVFNDYYNDSIFDMILDSHNEEYNPTMGIIYILDYSFDLILFAYSILILFIFFKKRSSLPILIIIYYGFNFSFITIMVLLSKNYTVEIISEPSDMITALVACVIWIPYFLISDRVKNTFTVRI